MILPKAKVGVGYVLDTLGVLGRYGLYGLVLDMCWICRVSWAVDTDRGYGLAKEYGIKFFETSAKKDQNVTE
eukprot:1342922-Amorphochlora_amoeboformis.AAC.1